MLAFAFLNPLLLWAVPLCAVPIVIHLLNRRRFQKVPWAAMEFLLRHRWPGNLRELRNTLDYASSMAGDATIDVADLPRLGTAQAAANTSALRDLLQAHHWNVSEVARVMGIARMTVYRRMKREGIVAPQHAIN